MPTTMTNWQLHIFYDSFTNKVIIRLHYTILGEVCVHKKIWISNFNFLYSIILLHTQKNFSTDVTHADVFVIVLAYIRLHLLLEV